MNTHSISVLDRLLDTLGRILTPDVARKLVNLRVDNRARARIDTLACRCNARGISDAERREYKAYVHAMDFIAILQAKARLALKRSEDS